MWSRFVTSAWSFCSLTTISGYKTLLPRERLGSFGWKCEAIAVEMQSHQGMNIVLRVRQPLPNSFCLSTVMEPTLVIALHWICSTVYWDADFKITGSGVLVLFCLILSAVT